MGEGGKEIELRWLIATINCSDDDLMICLMPANDVTTRVLPRLQIYVAESTRANSIVTAHRHPFPCFNRSNREIGKHFFDSLIKVDKGWCSVSGIR
jgi:hypothetical protein